MILNEIFLLNNGTSTLVPDTNGLFFCIQIGPSLFSPLMNKVSGFNYGRSNLAQISIVHIGKTRKDKKNCFSTKAAFNYTVLLDHEKLISPKPTLPTSEFSDSYSRF